MVSEQKAAQFASVATDVASKKLKITCIFSVCVSLILIVGTAFILFRCNKVKTIVQTYRYWKEVDPINDPIFYGTPKYHGYRPSYYNFTTQQYLVAKVWGLLHFHSSDFDKNAENRLLDLAVVSLSRNQFNARLSEILESIPSYTSEDKRDVEYRLLDNAWIFDTTYFHSSLSEKLFGIWNGSKSETNSDCDASGVPRFDALDWEHPEMHKKEALKAFFLYWSVIDLFYVHKSIISRNWDSVLYVSLPKFNKVSNVNEYKEQIQNLTANLSDSHCDVTDYFRETHAKLEPNFFITKIENKYIVTRLRLFGDCFPIKIGDEIISLNEIDLNSIKNTYSDKYLGSNDRSTERVLNRWLLRSNRKINKLHIRRNLKDTAVIVNYFPIEEIYDKEDELLAFFKPAIQLSKSLAYCNIKWLNDNNISEAVEFLDKYPSFILDLRGYPKGLVAFELLDFLLPYPTDYFKIVYTDPNAPGRLRITNGYLVGNKKKEVTFKGKCFIIVDEQTQSQAEFLCMALQQSSAVKVIGRTSAGADGNVAYLRLPENIKTYFTGVGVLYSDLSPTQRTGVKIDKRIEYTYENAIKGKDDLIIAALNLIYGERNSSETVGN